MGDIATNEKEATPVNADMDSGGTTVKKVQSLIERRAAPADELLSKHPSALCVIIHAVAQQQLIMSQESCHHW